MVGCLWLLFSTARGKPGEGTTGHVWDETLKEYNNPLPRWWLNMFVLTVLFGFGYLAFYPGLGNFAGRLGWTEKSEMKAQLDEIRARRNAVYATLGTRDLPSLAKDPAVASVGRELFVNNCAGCHGADARGALGFPDLTDKDWLYGGTPENILASITNGRNGQMPAFNGAIDPATLTDLVSTVSRWSDPTLDTAIRARGMKQFNITCLACHGPDGKGNTAIGSANLTDDIWLHGGSREQIRETILFGRNSTMPAHKDILSADDIRVVASYVYSLSHPL